MLFKVVDNTQGVCYYFKVNSDKLKMYTRNPKANTKRIKS